MSIAHWNKRRIKASLSVTVLAASPVPTEADGSFSAWIHTDQANSAVLNVKDRNNNSASQYIGVAAEAAPGAAFEYDANGNTTKITTSAAGQPTFITTFEWDAWDRLVAVVKGTHRSEFTYNGSGQRVRIKEIEGGAVISDTAYLWEGLKIVASSVNVSAGFDKFYFDDGFIDQNGSFCYSKDRLGSIRNVVNSSGAVVATYNYDAYGNVTTSGSSPGIADFLYTGHYYHASSGLYLAPHRAYDPKIGRWLSREPLGLDGPNLYHYVFNDPLNSYDFSGLHKKISGMVLMTVTFRTGITRLGKIRDSQMQG